MSRLPRTLVGLLALALGGCVALPEQEPVSDRYVLNPLPPAGEGTEAPSRELGLATPEVSPGLDSPRIAVIRGEHRLDHYARASWAAPLPELLRAFFAQSIENRLGLTPWRREDARLELVTAVRAFQAEYPGQGQEPPVLRVVMVADLRDARTGEVLVRTRETRYQPAAGNRLEAVVRGLEDLLRDAFGQVLETVAPHLPQGGGPSGGPA